MAGEDAEKDIAGEKTEQSPDSAEQQSENAGAETTEDSADSTGQNGDAGEIDTLIEEAVAAALAEQQDTVLRAKAEVQNMRRRCEQDVEKAHKFALERFTAELLTVIDNLERALEAVVDTKEENVLALKEGVELTLKGFLEICEKFNIRQMDPVGEPFDPQLHQAISMVENPDVEANTVVTVVQKGYLLNDRVIRPAMVIVSKAG